MANWPDNSQAASDNFKAARTMVIKQHANIGAYLPEMPKNDIDRMVMQIYAEIFIRAGTRRPT